MFALQDRSCAAADFPNPTRQLGERLAEGSASLADTELLEQVLAAYDEVISRALEIIEPLGYRPTSRLKTSGTLIEKLQRERGMKLKGVQDIAGLRIVLSRDQDQDEVVAELVIELERATASAVKVVDRRDDPSHGYRAVHLIAKINGMPIEVQVRTFLQDRWAQTFEALADRWGRQIRYGGDPVRVTLTNLSINETRADLVNALRFEVADMFNSADRAMREVHASRRLAARFESLADRVEFESHLAQFEAGILPQLDEALRILERLGRLSEQMDRGET